MRILLVEPNQPDAHWLEIMLGEADLPVNTLHYSTGVRALEALREGVLGAIDAIVVADVLPMLTGQEFENAVRSLDVQVPMIVVGERLRALPSVSRADEQFTKPLSTNDLQRLWRVVSNQRTLQAHQRIA